MTTKRQIFLFFFFVCSFLTEQFIWYLFPFATGLAGLICWPTVLISASCLTYLLYRLIKRVNSKRIIIGLAISLFVLQFIFLLYIHPQDYAPEPIDQLKEYVKSYQSHDEIDFNKFDSLNRPERVAFIYKYKNKLPKSISVLYIDTLISSYTNRYQRQYTIYNYDKYIIYDTTKLKILQTDTSTYVEEIVNNKTMHKLYKWFINGNGVGFIDTVNNYQYNIYKDTFDLNSGTEKIYFNLLSLTKKASR